MGQALALKVGSLGEGLDVQVMHSVMVIAFVNSEH
jgi:hypothetical protein